MSLDCLAVGILVADHLCTPIPRVPAAGELILCDELPLRIGGCASNSAIDLARVGVKVGIAGCVGQDAFGGFIRDTLDAAGVDTESLLVRPGVGTSGTLIINVTGEDRRFIHTLGANATFTAADVPWDRVLESRVLYLGGYLLMPALDPHAIADVLKRARAAGVTTVVDVVLPGPDDHWSKLEPLLPHTDVFLPNDDESALITGLEQTLAQAECMHQAGAKTVVVTCGEQGTVLVNDRMRLRAGTYPIEFVGGTGAGDAFDAGYIAGLLAGEDPIGCVKWGSALGASCVRSVGATDSVFTRDEALEFMKQHELAIERL